MQIFHRFSCKTAAHLALKNFDLFILFLDHFTLLIIFNQSFLIFHQKALVIYAEANPELKFHPTVNWTAFHGINVHTKIKNRKNILRKTFDWNFKHDQNCENENKAKPTADRTDPELLCKRARKSERGRNKKYREKISCGKERERATSATRENKSMNGILRAMLCYG